MKLSPRSVGALGAFAFAVAAIPLTAISSPAISHAEDDCDFNYFLNTATNHAWWAILTRKHAPSAKTFRMRQQCAAS